MLSLNPFFLSLQKYAVSCIMICLEFFLGFFIFWIQREQVLQQLLNKDMHAPYSS